MLTDTEIRIQGFKTLTNNLGEVQAERFIALLIREPFDYTKWQRKLWQNRSVDDISHSAMKNREQY